MFFTFGLAAWDEGFTTFTRAAILYGRQYLTIIDYDIEEEEEESSPRTKIRIYEMVKLSFLFCHGTVRLIIYAILYCTCQIASLAFKLPKWILSRICFSMAQLPRLTVNTLKWIWYGMYKIIWEACEIIWEAISLSKRILIKFWSLIYELPKLIIDSFKWISFGFLFLPAVMSMWIWHAMCSILWAAFNLPQLALNRIRREYDVLQTWLNQPESATNQDIPDDQIRPPALDMAEVKSSFLDACKTNNKATMRKLLKEHGEHIDVNMIQYKTGDTALHLAVREGHLAIVESLLSVKEKLVDVNIVNSNGETPLLIASATGHVGIVKRLLRVRGIKLKDGCGERAVMKAIGNYYFEVAQVIMDVIENKGIDTKMLKPKNLLTSCLNRYVRLANELSSGGGRSRSEHDVQRLSQRLETYRKSILSIVSLREPETMTVPDRKSLKESRNEMRECLECTICYENFEDMKVFACTRDHWICVQCLPHNDRCPSCREDFNVHPPTRRVTCEKFLAIVRDHLSLCDE